MSLMLKIYSLAFSFKSTRNMQHNNATYETKQIPMKSEEFAMTEIPQNKGTKRMKLSFYMQDAPYAQGKKNIHFIFTDRNTERKRYRKKVYKKWKKYMTTRPLLETLTSYIEASKCKTLEKFIEKEVRQ
jgi:hypothetical protein